MLKQIEKRLNRSHNLYLDLVDFIDENILSSKLKNLPSNTVGQQIWCVIGARQSFIKAAIAGDWQGFDCPLEYEEAGNKNAIQESLIRTNNQFTDLIKGKESLSDSEIEWLLSLLEHEVQHHGQLIRYMYGLKLGVPSSWKERYNLD